MTQSDETETKGARRQLPLMRVVVVALLAAAALAAYERTAFGSVVVITAFFLLACLALSQDTAVPRRDTDPRRRQVPLWPDSGAKSVVEAIAEPAFMIDRNLLLRFQNGVSEQLFGAMALGDAISLRFRSPELIAAIETSVRERKVGFAALVEGRAVERSWSVDILPVPVPQGGEAAFFLLLFRDRTAERRIEQMRTDFIANASHELRTPLASLMGFIETLQGPARDDAAARLRFLDIMRDQAARMSRLIDDLLSLSRIEMKRHVPVESLVDLGEILEEVCEALSPLAAETGVEIVAEPAVGPLKVAGERDELVQVFANLVENACKYGESGGRVVISLIETRERDRLFRDVAIRDFGPGIPPEHVPRLTERFYRVDVGSSRGKRGTGLGLSIVRNILVRHRARLIIHSIVGEGSTFTARFPAVDQGTA
jgi:two-component system phosphate regulon sensor histidine kinase PhoR